MTTLRKFPIGLLLISFISVFAVFAEASEDDRGYLSVTGPCAFQFPRDQGAHPGFRTEWWYYTGNLTAENGQDFGFQLTIFRRQISPLKASNDWPLNSSAWRTQHLYLGHAAVSDMQAEEHLFDEVIARGALGLAGAAQSDNVTRIFIKRWSIQIEDTKHRLSATTSRFKIELILEPEKQPVAHGNRGYSLKGDSPERASCYYSFTRLNTIGIITVDGRPYTVAGLSWMDHEFSTSPLQPGILGWDWFSLQLSDNTEMMAFLFREEDGKLNQASSGTLIRADGQQRHLTVNDFVIKTQDTWQSPHSGAVYPQSWLVTIPEENITLSVRSRFSDQEMRTEDNVGISYWEGSALVEGTVDDHPVEGKGYVELTGYSREFEQDLW